MLMLYLLWIIVVFGGLFMGLGAVWAISEQGVQVDLVLLAVMYIGCAIYGMPKLYKTLFKRS